MDHMKLETPDLTAQNIEKIGGTVPQLCYGKRWMRMASRKKPSILICCGRCSLLMW